MAQFSITLPGSITVQLGDTGKTTLVPIGTFPASTIQFAVLQGFMGALNNISRGKDENDRPNSDDVWLAAREKRMNAWRDGTAWGSTTRESNVAPLRQAYIDETRARTKQTVAEVEKDMAALIKSTLGEKEKATWANFLDALATAIGKERKMPVEEVKEKLEAKYAKMADEARKDREGVSAKLDVSMISLD